MWFVLCFILSVAAVNGVPTTRIVGGQDAPDGKYPYQASLNIYGSHSCGGSIVSNRFILTAAHCLQRYIPLPNILIVIGTNSLNEGGVAYDVDQIFIHHFTPDGMFRNDIALIRTKKEIEFTEKIQPIKLSDHNFHAHGDPAVLTGWGLTHMTSANSPDKLQEINLRIFGMTECKKQLSNLLESQICTLTEKGEGACMGDSGGPLVVGGVQVGIVSYGRPCALGYPDVYTAVFYYADWINEIIN